jgi:dTDP-4-amino-4,6-dideoxygalactose transaminase
MAVNRTIAFVENKEVDFARISDLLKDSRNLNHYSNFGPISKMLESVLAGLLALSPAANLSSMFCSSGTTALNAAAGALSTIQGKNLRWLVSANGFYSTRIGPFTNSIVVDCDSRGLLDLKAAEHVADSNFDGVVYTNLFGYFDDFEPGFEFCRLRGKALIIDNAASLGTKRSYYGAAITETVPWIEIFSFHQTKPWGLGEGGAAVFPLRLRNAFHDMINFGIDLSPDVQVYAGNGKISEVACGMIMTRLESMSEWADRYRTQAKRIIGLGRSVGLTPIVNELPPRSVPGHVPFFSPYAVPFASLTNEVLVLQKYYRPLDESCRRAVDRFERTLSVPCHPAVSSLSDNAICGLLARYA